MADVTSILATIDESARRRFEQAWRAGEMPDPAAFLPSPESQYYLPTLEELVHIDLEFRWRPVEKGTEKQNGDGAEPPARHLVEHYLAAFPALAAPGVLRRLIDQERRVRGRAGERPAAGEYATRFPNLDLTGASDTLDSSADGDSNPTGLTPAGHSKTMIGTARIPGYEILEVLGRGGIGVVYKARQVRLNRLVAIKMLLAGVHAGGEERARFEREAEAVARLTHPQIVQVHEVGEAEGRLYIVFEFLPGGNLAQKLAGTPLAAEEAAALVATLADAVEHAHEHGVIHRDLKPTNVMLTLDGTCKIGDFGLAKQLTEEQGNTRTGDILGTPSYMAPEQAGGRIKEIGPPTDVYALGAILYEVVTGRPPFRAETAWETLSQVLAQEPVTPRQLAPRLPADLETICLKCLEKEPAKRYATAQELAGDLRRFLAHEPIVARPASALEKAFRWCARNPSLAAAALLLVILLVGTAGGAVWYGFHQQQVAADLKDANDKTNAALAKANRLSADLLFERGLGYCQRGEVDLGLLWMNAAYARTSESDADLRGALRANLGVWSQQLATLLEVHRYDGPISLWRRSASGRFVATVHVEQGDTRSLRLWDAAQAREIGPPLSLPQPPQMAFSPDESSLWIVVGGKLGRIEAATATRVGKEFPVAEGRVLEMEVSPKGDYIALVFQAPATKTAPFPSRLEIIETSTGRRVQKPLVLAGYARPAFVPDDSSLLVAVNLPAQQTPENEFASQAEVHQYHIPDLSVVHAPSPILSVVSGIACSPQGGQFAVVGNDGSAWLISTQTRIPFGLLTPTHDGSRLAPPCLEFSPDGQWLAIANGRGVSVTPTHDPASNSQWQAHDHEIASVAFDAAGEVLITTSLDGTSRLWDPATGQRIGVPIRRNFSATTPWVSCDPRGMRLVVGGEGRTLEWWDLATVRGSVGRGLRHADEVTQLAFVPGSQLLASVAALPTVSTGPPLHGGKEEPNLPVAPSTPALPGLPLPSLPLHGPPLPNPTTPMGESAIIEDNLPSAGPASPPMPTPPLDPGQRPPPGLPGPNQPFLPPLQERPDMLLPPPPLIPLPPPVAILGPAAGPSALRLWNAKGQLAVGPIVHPARIACVAFAPGVAMTGSQNGEVRRFRLPGGDPIGDLLQLGQPVTAVALSGDGRVMAAGGDQGLIRRWEVADAKVLPPDFAVDENVPTQVRELVLNRDGKLIVALPAKGFGGGLRRFSDKAPAALLFPKGNPACAVLSPDERWLLTNDTSAQAWLIDITQESVRRERIPHSYPVLSAAFSPDGKVLATGSGMAESTPRGEVCFFNVETREPIGAPIVHEAPVRHVAFDAAGRRLLSFCSGNAGYPFGTDVTAAQVWDVATGKRIGPARHLTGGARVAAFDPAGERLAVGGQGAGMANPREEVLDDDLGQTPSPSSHAASSTGEVRLWSLPTLAIADDRLADWGAHLTRRRLNARGLPGMLDDTTWRAARDALKKAPPPTGMGQ